MCIEDLRLQGQTTSGKADVHSAAGPIFIDVSRSWGVNFKHESKHSSQKYLPETMGAGVAALDYNDDGLVDLFFVNAAELRDPMRVDAAPDKSQPRYWNRLYRNDGDGKFSSITRSKPTAFQAVSFKQFWMRMGGWKNIGEERIRSTTSNITSYGSRSTATRCYGAGWQSGCGI